MTTESRHPERQSYQRQQVLAYLRNHDGITVAEAISELNIYRLAARIHELRAAGYEIATDQPKGTFAVYRLESEPELVGA